MKVFRIAKERYIHDLSGEGSRQFGGRWNKKGTSVLYTAENRSLATVEYLVHVPLVLLPADTWIAEITIPDEIGFESIAPEDLSEGWATYPAPVSLSEIGQAWVARNKTLLFKVPSSVVKGEWNFLINPNHEQFNEVLLTGAEKFAFDERLRKPDNPV